MESQNAMGVRVSGRASAKGRKARKSTPVITPVRVSASSLKRPVTSIPVLKVSQKTAIPAK